MDSGWKRTIVISVGILALGAGGGLIASTALVSRVLHEKIEAARRNEQTLAVTGSARKRVRADVATWAIEVSADGKDLKSTYPVLKTGYDSASAYLTKNGFKPDEIQPGSIQTKVQYHKDKNSVSELIGYMLSRSITVRTPRVDAVANPAAEVTALIEEGINISSNPPQYTLSNLSPLKIEMIGEASKDARSRAEELISHVGGMISSVRSARVGVMQITTPDSTEVSEGGIYDTSSIEKDVRAVVNLTFGMETGK